MNVLNVRTPLLSREVDWEDVGVKSYACGKLCLCCEGGCCSKSQDVSLNWLGIKVLVSYVWGLITLGTAFSAQPHSRGVLISSAIAISFYALSFFSNCTFTLAAHYGFEKSAVFNGFRLGETCFDLIGIALFSSALIINQSKG